MTIQGKYVSNAVSIGYPNPNYFLGSFSTDPTNTSPGQWWYNTTTMQIKENINGTIQVLGAFAGSFSSTTYITSNTTIGGSGITVNYVNLVITNNATLTIAAGSNVNVAGIVNITAGSTIIMQGATVNVYNALQNAGTLQSTSSSDSIQAVQVQNTGNMQINGTLYLPSAGYNHILAGSVSGSGTLNIQGTAIVLIGDSLQLSISIVNGNGTLQIQQNGVCTVNGNTTFSIATVSGSGTLSVSSGYTLTFSGSNLLPTTLTVSGTLALSGNYTLVTNITNGTGTIQINSGYTLTVSSNITLGFSTVSGSGTLSVSSGYTLTIGASATFSIATVSGAGTLSVSSGYTLTIGASATFSIATVSGSGTLSVSSGYTLTLSNCNVSVSNLGNGSVITTATSTSNTIQSIPILAGYTLTVYNTTTITADPAKNIFIPSGQVVTIGASITTSSADAYWAGAGTLSIPTNYTLTQGASIILGLANVNINAGTWANAGYGITIPSGVTCSWYIPGSLTTGTTAGTLTVNGVFSYSSGGSGITDSTSNGTLPSFVLNLAGTGIAIIGHIWSPSGTTNTISLSNTSIAANGETPTSATGTGNHALIYFSSISGSVAGKYGVGVYNSTASSYYFGTLIYVGTANTIFNLNNQYNINLTTTAGNTYYGFNNSASAGTITLSGSISV